MKTLRKIITVVMTVVSCLVMLSVTAFAAAVQSNNSTIINYITANGTSGLPTNATGLISVKGSIEDLGADSAYVLVEGSYYCYKLSNEETIANAINTSINQKEQNEKDIEDTKNRIDVMKEGLSITADTETAVRSISGFTGAISFALGVLVVLITLGMTLFSAFDLCYIAFPVFREKCEDARTGGNRFMTKTDKTSGESKLRFVTDDAQFAVTAADTTQSGKNPFIIYFKKRIISYIVLAILLFILLSGNITVLTSLAIGLVDGILGLIPKG